MPATPAAPALPPGIEPVLLEGIPATSAQEIVAAATRRRYFAGQILIHSGDSATHFYLLLSGRARHYSVTDRGQRLVLGWLMPGDAFGISALVRNARIYRSDLEMEKEGEVLMWESAAIQELAERYPALYKNALIMAAELVSRYHAISVSLATLTAEERLAQALRELSRSRGRTEARGVELHVTNEHLADMANITLFTASRLLSAWHQRGDIVKGRGKIVVRAKKLLGG